MILNVSRTVYSWPLTFYVLNLHLLSLFLQIACRNARKMNFSSSQKPKLNLAVTLLCAFWPESTSLARNYVRTNVLFWLKRLGTSMSMGAISSRFRNSYSYGSVRLSSNMILCSFILWVFVTKKLKIFWNTIVSEASFSGPHVRISVVIIDKIVGCQKQEPMYFQALLELSE